MDIYQILYGQCHIWDIFGLGLKIKVFCRKKMNDGNHGQGTHNAKMGADSLAENTPYTTKCIRPIFLIGPKGILLNEASSGVHSP